MKLKIKKSINNSIKTQIEKKWKTIHACGLGDLACPGLYNKAQTCGSDSPDPRV